MEHQVIALVITNCDHLELRISPVTQALPKPDPTTAAVIRQIDAMGGELE